MASLIIELFSLLIRIPTHSSVPPWSLMRCCVAQSLLCPVRSRADWETPVEALLRSTFPPSCFPLMKLWGTSAPFDLWWTEMWWLDMAASCWRSKLPSGEVNSSTCTLNMMSVWEINGFVFILTELEKQMKIENLFVTWQQRSAQSNMPISVSTFNSVWPFRAGHWGHWGHTGTCNVIFKHL